jgi:hypothetical protein
MNPARRHGSVSEKKQYLGTALPRAATRARAKVTCNLSWSQLRAKAICIHGKLRKIVAFPMG